MRLSTKPFIAVFDILLDDRQSRLDAYLCAPPPHPPPLTAPAPLETTTPSPSFYLCVQTMKIPWKQILTSGPFWAIVVAHCTYTWVTSWMMSYLPKYLNDILKFGVEEVRHIFRQLYRSVSIFSGNFWVECITLCQLQDLM